MYVALICFDKPDRLQLRLATRPAHLEHVNAHKALGKVAAGGPLFGPDGQPNGTMIVLDVADLAEAEAIAAADPYVKADLFATVEIRQWNWLTNPPAAKGS